MQRPIGAGRPGTSNVRRAWYLCRQCPIARRPARPAQARLSPSSGRSLLLAGLAALVLSSALASPLLAVSASAALGSAVVGRRRAVLLRRAAFTDRLTGLYRYEYFADALPREVERVRRFGSELSLVVFDLDRFKDSTTSTGTRPATRCSRASAARCCARHAAPTWPRASAARS